MARLPLSDDDRSAARAEAIAAMGLRLAASSPRVRARLRERQGWTPAECAFSENNDPPVLPREAGFTWKDGLLFLRRSVWLGSAACCGFGLVLIGLNLSLARRDGPPAKAEQAARGAEPTFFQDIAVAALAPPGEARDYVALADPPSLFAEAWVAPPQAAPETMQLAHATLRPAPSVIQATATFGKFLPALHAAPRRQSEAVARLVPKPAFRPARFATRDDLAAYFAALPVRTSGARGHARGARVVLASAARPMPRFDMPRWLDEAPAPDKPRILSPPPHDLTQPADPVAKPEPPAPRRLPPLVVASSGYAPPAYRPPYGMPGTPYYPPYGYWGGSP